MKEYNPSYKYNIDGKKQSIILETLIVKKERIKQSREKMSNRMKLNNPMKDSAIAKKVGNKIKQLYENGTIKKKIGKDSPIWKGNRNRAQIIRSRLYKIWILPILKRDNFTCLKCGKHNCRLEVHHVSETFRDILKSCLNGKILENISYKEFEKISESVIKKHKNITGATYCVPCHKKVDKQRR